MRQAGEGDPAEDRRQAEESSSGGGLATVVLGELTQCLRMIGEDLASGIDLAGARVRWLERLKEFVATLEGAPREGGQGDAASGMLALSIETGHERLWDFGGAHALLSVRQREVVEHWLRGYQAGEIGRLLSIGKSTAQTHLRDALRELRTSGEPEALRLVERCARRRKPRSSKRPTQ